MNGKNKYNMVFFRPSLSQAIPDGPHVISEPSYMLFRWKNSKNEEMSYFSIKNVTKTAKVFESSMFQLFANLLTVVQEIIKDTTIET